MIAIATTVRDRPHRNGWEEARIAIVPVEISWRAFRKESENISQRDTISCHRVVQAKYITIRPSHGRTPTARSTWPPVEMM